MTDTNTGDLSMEIAKRVTALRLHKTWTRDMLAQEADINVYTLKHFERTGQISLQRLIRVAHALEVIDEVERLFKPRHRVDVQNWEVNYPTRKRGRRRTAIQQGTIKDTSTTATSVATTSDVNDTPEK